MPDTAIPPPTPLEDEWVMVPQIADVAGVQSNAVNQWRNRLSAEAVEQAKASGKAAARPPAVELIAFPEPDDYIGAFPIWRLSRIVAWFEATGRARMLDGYDLEGFRAKRDAGGYRRDGKKGDTLNQRWTANSTTSKTG